jgi:uncharacterized delta-60 repeat protein
MSRIVRVPRVSTVVCAAITIVMAAAFGPLIRLIATAGDLDPSFGIGGVATAPVGQFAYANAVAVQPDGKVVAAGPDGAQIRVARFNPDGSLDSGFGAGGLVGTNVGGNELPFKVLLRPDGRIVVVARADVSLGLWMVAAVQYNPDGSLDGTFGAGGVAVHHLTQTLHEVHDAALQPDGGVLVVGHAYFGPAPVPYIDFTTLRFTPDGAFDVAFGTNGLLHTNIYGGDEARAIAMQPDGRFVLAGFSDTAPGARRHFAFVRYLPDGELDTSFGTDGTVTIDPALGLPAVQSWIYDVIVQPDGRIVGAGFTEYSSGQADGAVVRLLPDGQIDPSFSDDGRAIFDDGAISNSVGAAVRGGLGRLALQANGRLLAAGGIDAVLGIHPDGTLDPDFHGDGIARIPGAPNDMALQDDGKIIIGTMANVSSQLGFRVLRLIGDNTPPALTPATVSVHRGTSPRLTIGMATDTSDAVASLVVAPVAGTLPAGLTFTNFLVNATTGAVSAVVTASCTVATGIFDVQFSITDAGNATTFATVPVEVLPNTPPTLSLADKTVNEGHTSAAPAVLVLTANGTVCAPVSVTYATADGTAVAPGDYTAASGTATIAVGASSTTISVPVIGERVAENDETFLVTLGAPINASIADGEAVVTIRDDEPSIVQFAAIMALDVLETDASSPAQIVNLKLVRLTGLSTTAIVSISISGTASFISDFDFPDEPFVTFNPGQAEAELRVRIVADLVEEATETVTISINEWVNASIGSPSSAQITIRDNDGAPADPDKPVVIGSVPSPNAAGWHKADLSVALSAVDGTGSGVKSVSYALSGAQAQALTVVPAATVSIPIVTEGITTVTFFAEDVAGNVAATQSLTVRLDKTAPGVVITSPQARPYTLNEAAAAAYACTDSVSGVVSCTGTTASGGAIDTASAGPRTFSATATDAAGNSATAHVAYSVMVPPPTFTLRALYDPAMEHIRNSAIPIKLQVVNAAGENVSSSGLVVEALAVSSGTEIGPAEEELLADDAGQANPLGRFRFVAEGAYLFNLKTTNLKAGPYVLVVRVAGDSALHALPFLIREP